LVKEAMANEIGVDVQQITYVDDTIKTLPVPMASHTPRRHKRRKKMLH
jgi:hypothetical protein